MGYFTVPVASCNFYRQPIDSLLHIGAFQGYYEATVSPNEHHELENILKDGTEDWAMLLLRDKFGK